MRANASAPPSERKQPDTFCWTLSHAGHARPDSSENPPLSSGQAAEVGVSVTA
jgi:hypothetical protein